MSFWLCVCLFVSLFVSLSFLHAQAPERPDTSASDSPPPSRSIAPTMANAPKKSKALKAMTQNAIEVHIALTTELHQSVIKEVLQELTWLAHAEILRCDKFVIPQLVTLKRFRRPATKEHTKKCFNKPAVTVRAKPAMKLMRCWAVRETLRRAECGVAFPAVDVESSSGSGSD